MEPSTEMRKVIHQKLQEEFADLFSWSYKYSYDYGTMPDTESLGTFEKFRSKGSTKKDFIAYDGQWRNKKRHG